ncbi:MAG: 50S ribosomal protein L17 [Bacteroidetes bacterium]|nr:50S ribosomal protein L17 [Bacteroidota bacterium]
MRHGKRFNHLSRTSAHRKAMLANMASSLIIHKRIKTTVAKAKALRTYIEPLITKSKTDSTHSRRVVFSYLNDKDAVTELFREISVKVADRPGGYTRIIKIGARMGDNAEMALIELVDYNENLLDAKAKGPKKTRRRRGGKKQEEGAEVAEQAVETAEEAVEDASEEEKEEAAAETTEEVKEEAEAEEVKIEEVKEEPKEEVKEEPKAEEVKIEEVKEEEKPASDEAPEDEEKKDKKE